MCLVHESSTKCFVWMHVVIWRSFEIQLIKTLNSEREQISAAKTSKINPVEICPQSSWKGREMF